MLTKRDDLEILNPEPQAKTPTLEPTATPLP